MSFAVDEATDNAEYSHAGETASLLQYSAAAVARLCSSIETYSHHGAQVWATVPGCSPHSFGSGFQPFAERLNKALESRRAAAAQAYDDVAALVPEVAAGWQQFDEIEAGNRQKIKIVGDYA